MLISPPVNLLGWSEANSSVIHLDLWTTIQFFIFTPASIDIFVKVLHMDGLTAVCPPVMAIWVYTEVGWLSLRAPSIPWYPAINAVNTDSKFSIPIWVPFSSTADRTWMKLAYERRDFIIYKYAFRPLIPLLCTCLSWRTYSISVNRCVGLTSAQMFASNRNSVLDEFALCCTLPFVVVSVLNECQLNLTPSAKTLYFKSLPAGKKAYHLRWCKTNQKVTFIHRRPVIQSRVAEEAVSVVGPKLPLPWPHLTGGFQGPPRPVWIYNPSISFQLT